VIAILGLADRFSARGDGACQDSEHGYASRLCVDVCGYVVVRCRLFCGLVLLRWRVRGCDEDRAYARVRAPILRGRGCVHAAH
jgi:hypothetical protein